ncbi:MAG: acyl-CoA ligase (AMP-forming), exosortase A system-associated [Acidobacteriota bacterium]
MQSLIHHYLRDSAQRQPDKEALVHGDVRFTYREMRRLCSGLAQGLRGIGLKRGDRVGIWLAPSTDQAISIFAVSQSGGAFVPINHLLFPDQVLHIANDCRMSCLITSRSKLALMGPRLRETPFLESLVVLSDGGPTTEASLPLYDLHALCALPTLSDREDWGIERDLAAILYTSGSTGRPKGVMLNHAQIMAGSSIVSEYLKINGADRILLLLPLSFDAGLNQLMTAMQQSATLVIKTFVYTQEIVKTLLDEKITGVAGVPTLWTLLSQPNSTLCKHQFPCLRYITNTGGAMPQTVLAVLRQALPGTEIFLMYGLTEAFRSTYLPPEELNKRPTSMGKAIPNTEILVVNEEGKPCGPDEVGELVHRGPTVSMGYWGDPELTAKVLRPHPFLPTELKDAERVCYSGDLVKTDEEGFLYFVGRADAMIKSSGFRISPTEVEEVLYRTEELQGAAVIGVPDDVLGQVVKAYVVRKQGSKAEASDLIAFCSKHLPRHMVPRLIEFIDELPKTTSGKVDYPALRRTSLS